MVVFWAYTVVYWANTVVFWENTVVFWEKTVVFWANTVKFWENMVDPHFVSPADSYSVGEDLVGSQIESQLEI